MYMYRKFRSSYLIIHKRNRMTITIALLWWLKFYKKYILIYKIDLKTKIKNLVYFQKYIIIFKLNFIFDQYVFSTSKIKCFSLFDISFY